MVHPAIQKVYAPYMDAVRSTLQGDPVFDHRRILERCNDLLDTVLVDENFDGIAINTGGMAFLQCFVEAEQGIILHGEDPMDAYERVYNIATPAFREEQRKNAYHAAFPAQLN